MSDQLRRALFLFVLQFFGYLIVTLNMRAVANLNYPFTFLTDILIATIGFTSIKQIIEAQTRMEQIAYISGGALGAQLALLLSRWL